MVSFKDRKALSTLLALTIVIAVVIVAVGLYFLYSPSELITEEMEYSDFTAVDVSSAFQVEITHSSSYSVIITAEEKIFDKINVTKTGNTLVISIEPNLVPTSVLKAEITMPNLVKLVLSGACKGTIEGFSSSDTFIAELSGASHLEMQDTTVGNVQIELTGASTLIAEGSGNGLFSNVEGASSLDLTTFPVVNGDLMVSGASQVTVNLDGTLNATVSGASTLYYIGEPTLGNMYTYGDSTINKK